VHNNDESTFFYELLLRPVFIVYLPFMAFNGPTKHRIGPHRTTPRGSASVRTPKHQCPTRSCGWLKCNRTRGRGVVRGVLPPQNSKGRRGTQRGNAMVRYKRAF